MRLPNSIILLSLITSSLATDPTNNLRRKHSDSDGLPSSIQQSNTTPQKRVFVKYRHGKRRAFQTELAKRSSKTKMHHDFQNMDTMVLSMPADELEALKKSPDVERIHDDVLRYPQYIKDSVRPFHRDLQQNEQIIPYGVDMVQAPEVWKLGAKGQGVKVCVVDTGIDANHEDFTKLSGLQSSSLPWETDGVGHGTHCAGTIAAVDNNVGVVGVAPEAEIYTIKVFSDSGLFAYSSGILAAAEKCAEEGADIISMSLGGPLPNPFELFGFRSLLNDFGVITVAAAGNFGNFLLSFPASYPGVVSVGALDEEKKQASFSQYNFQVDFAAPGVEVLSTFPMEAPCSICERKGYKYGFISGTSMACPHVAGALALLKSFSPESSPEQLVEALQKSAEDLGRSGKDSRYGHGLIQTFNATAYLNAGSLRDAINQLPSQADAPSATGCSDYEHNFSLKMLTDAYAAETSWELRRISDGGVHLAGAGYDNDLAITVDRCIPKDCYTFTVFDSANDGLCCGYGLGGYSLSIDGVSVVNNGGDFGDADVTTFGSCAPSSRLEKVSRSDS